MQIIDEPLNGLYVLQPTVFEDNRGYFFEAYNQNVFKNIGIEDDFLQDNQSLSKSKNVVRGLHFQAPPYAQAKLVRAVTGAVLDVVVDIRKSSPTYGKSYSIELTEKNKLFLYIPIGFAHGFATLEPNTLFNYKCSNVYNKPSEGCILWNDPDLAIEWGVDQPILSEKDQLGVSFLDFNTPFD